MQSLSIGRKRRRRNCMLPSRLTDSDSEGSAAEIMEGGVLTTTPMAIRRLDEQVGSSIKHNYADALAQLESKFGTELASLRRRHQQELDELQSKHDGQKQALRSKWCAREKSGGPRRQRHSGSGRRTACHGLGA